VDSASIGPSLANRVSTHARLRTTARTPTSRVTRGAV
jgi:hypothetical protein